MNHKSARLLAFTCIALLLACHRPPSQADLRHLEQAQRTVKTRATLALEGDLYVKVLMMPRSTLSSAELEQLYRAFFLLPDGTRRETSFVYMNVYDSRGAFLFQLSYDPRLKTFGRGRSEHY